MLFKFESLLSRFKTTIQLRSIPFYIILNIQLSHLSSCIHTTSFTHQNGTIREGKKRRSTFQILIPFPSILSFSLFLFSTAISIHLILLTREWTSTLLTSILLWLLFCDHKKCWCYYWENERKREKEFLNDQKTTTNTLAIRFAKGFGKRKKHSFPIFLSLSVNRWLDADDWWKRIRLEKCDECFWKWWKSDDERRVNSKIDSKSNFNPLSPLSLFLHFIFIMICGYHYQKSCEISLWSSL